MDIDLLAKMVKELVTDHDCVTLPGVGCFVAELVPSSFTDRGYTILPPYRRLYFSPRQEGDTLLVDLYAKANDISQDDSAKILQVFLEEMKEVLKVKKTIVFPGLGRLRATRENHFFFVADEDLDIYPGGFGLQPISLKTHEETPEEVAQAVSSIAQILEPTDSSSPLAPSNDSEEPQPVIEEPEPEIEEPSDSVAPEEIPPVVPSEAEEPEEEPVIPEETREPEVAPSVPEEVPAVVPDEVPPVVSEEATSAISSETSESPSKGKGWKVFWKILLWLFIIAIVVAIALAAIGRLEPQWLDSILYTPEELDIIYK